MIDILNTAWIVLQLLAILVFGFWLSSANDGWGLFLGLELLAVALLFLAWVGLWAIGIDINNHRWLTATLISWPLVAMFGFQLVNTYRNISSRLKKNQEASPKESCGAQRNVEKPEEQPILPSVHKVVERAALICRKYALWNAEVFAREFHGIDYSVIRSAWSNALDKVKDDEVIEVSPRRGITKFIGHGIISEVVGKPEYEDDETNFNYLMSSLDGSTLSLLEEDREREIRRLLALRFVIRSRGAALGDANELLGSFVVPKGE